MRIRTYKKLHQLTILSRIFPINCYLYEEKDSLTVIDIGTSLFCRSIITLSQKLDKPITNILLTHPHADHISGLDQLKKKIPHAKTGISERDYLLMKGDYSVSEEKGLEIKGGFAKIETSPDFLVKDGMKIGSLLAISTPGHTPGSMSFYDEENGIIIVGDALQVAGGLSVAGDKRILFPFPALATWDKKRAVDSAKKLTQRPIAALAAGHGDILLKPEPILTQVIERADRKLRISKHEN